MSVLGPALFFFGKPAMAGDGARAVPPFSQLLTEAEWEDVRRELQLTPQQARVVELILQGMRDKQIAAALGLSLPTVRTHLRRLFSRIGISDRVELVLRAFAVTRATRSGVDIHHK